MKGLSTPSGCGSCGRCRAVLIIRCQALSLDSRSGAVGLRPQGLGFWL